MTSDARMIGRIGPHERLCRLNTIGWPLRSIDIMPGQITSSALIDARDTLLDLVDENAHAIMDASALMHECRKPLFEDRLALTRVLMMINKKIAGRSDHVHRTSTPGAVASADQAAAARQGRQRS